MASAWGRHRSPSGRWDPLFPSRILDLQSLSSLLVSGTFFLGHHAQAWPRRALPWESSPHGGEVRAVCQVEAESSGPRSRGALRGLVLLGWGRALNSDTQALCSLAAPTLSPCDICGSVPKDSRCATERKALELPCRPSRVTNADQMPWRGCGWSDVVSVHVSPGRNQKLLGSEKNEIKRKTEPAFP